MLKREVLKKREIDVKKVTDRLIERDRYMKHCVIFYLFVSRVVSSFKLFFDLLVGKVFFAGFKLIFNLIVTRVPYVSFT